MAERSAERAPLRAVVGTLIFTLVVPGTVIVYAPFALSRWRLSQPFLRIEAMRWAGAAIFVAALPIFVGFLTRFVREGRGTPAPIAPTERLVTGGTFKWIRNPGYVSVIGLLLGQTLFLGSRTLMLYTILVGIGFHLCS